MTARDVARASENQLLLREKQHLEPLLHISPTAIVITDLEANVVAWNPAAERLFGYTAEEALGRNLDDLVATTEDLHEAAVAFSQRTVHQDRVQTITRRTRKDGRLVDVEVHAAPLLADGEPVGTFGIYHDITELRRQKRYYESLIQASPEAIVTTTDEGIVTSWNPGAERLFGYSVDEAINRNLDDLVATRDDMHDEAATLTRKGETGHFVRQRTRKDGSIVDVDIVAAPVEIGDQQVARHVIYHDVTDIQRQKRFYEALLELSPAAIVAIDPQDNVTLWNPAAERLFGYTAAEATGRNVDDLVANNDEIREEAEALDLVTHDEQIRRTTRRTRKDGSLVDVELLGAPVMVGGELVGRYAIYLDISELQRQKQYYESLLEVSPTAIMTVDPSMTVTSWNPAAERLLGYTAEEAIGRNVDDLVAANRPDLLPEALAVSEQIKSGEVQVTARRTRKDGSLVDVAVTGAPIYVGGELVGMYALYHDITELQEQKRYFQSLLDLSPTAIVVTDLDTIITSWNPAAEQLFGYSVDEAVGRKLDDIVAARADLREQADAYSRAAAAGERVQAIARRTRKDGSLVDVQIFSAPVVIEDRPIGFVAVYHDITEIQRDKRYTESVLQLSPTAIVTVDEDFLVTSWNPAAEQLFGYSAEEADGRFIDDLVANSPDVREEAAGQNEIGRAGTGGRWISRRTRKDRSFVDVEIIAAPVYVSGERVGHVIIYHDITEIQRQKRYTESVLELSPTAIVTVDERFRVTSWNPAAEQLFGYTANEALGQPVDDLVANSPEIRDEAGRLNEPRESARLITRRTRKDGTFIDVEMVSAPVFVASERVGHVVIYHDISELQRARRDAEAAVRAKSAFLATMSHEIRTPLNAVIGMTGLLLDTNLAPEQQRFAEIIRNSGDALLSVINEILDFSKIEAGRLEMDAQPFDLSNCVEAVLELVATTASQKGLDLAYSIDPEVPAAIVGDETRIRQILLNLLNNAVKFTEQGEVVLTVGVERRGHGNGAEGTHEMHFAVRDTGIGIPDDRMDRLFESFTQVDASTTRRYGGTGLGLAISKRLVELMGGRMWVQSRLGQGSTFHFTIVADAAPAAPQAHRRQSPELQGKRVLIVDDNATNRQILRRQTESWGMLARDTGLPAQALEWIQRGDPFDIGILDMQMPDMDGVTLAKEIRKHRGSETLPLVMLTSIGRFSEVGMDEFAVNLTKPIKPSQLYDALMDVFGQQPAFAVSVPATERAAPPVPGALRILVAEDNAVNQQLAVLLLQKLGYRADVAGDGVEALEALERQPYDVVLMDVQMPEMDGLEATRRIHQRWAAERPYIVAVTANAMEGDREACIAAGMDDYISKPIRENEIAAALRRSSRGQSKPVLDSEALKRLRDAVGSDEAVAQLARTFVDDTERIMADLRADIASGRPAEARRLAHSLKSTAATFGASDLSNLCRELETVAEGDSLEGAKDILARIQDEFARVRAAIAEKLA